MREFRKATRDIQEDQEESVAELRPRNGYDGVHLLQLPRGKGRTVLPVVRKSLEAPRCSKCHRVNTLGAKFCVECEEALTSFRQF